MFGRAGLIVASILVMVLCTGMSAVDAPTWIFSWGKNTSAIANVAHRGASHYAPENTLAAVREAKRRNADMFEIDVQLTKDKKIILMHDTTLTRTTDAEELFPGRAPWNVGDFTYAEIRRLDAGSWFGPTFAGERVPTLGEVLREMRSSGLGLLLEVKSPELYPGFGELLADELRRHPSWIRKDPKGRRLVIQSFNWNFIRELQPLMPSVPHGLLGTPTMDQLPELAMFADQINPNHVPLSPDYVRSVHEYGMEVFTWTVNDPADMRRVIDMNVDGIITNRPDVLHSVLGGDQRLAA